MVIRRTKKTRRQRGGRSMGWGIVRDHKGAGMRGGVGNAGVTQHHWIRTVIEEKTTGKKIIGKYGFKRPQQFMQKYSTINVSHISESIDSLVTDGKANLEGDVYHLNLKDLGVTKLLAQGNVHKKINVTVERATQRAISKIEAAGGTVSIVSKD